MGLQKSKFSNSLENWEKVGGAAQAIQKSLFAKNLKVYAAQEQHFKIHVLNL